VKDPARQIATARLLVARLERLSADSYWAHQASGLRGSLLRCLEQFDSGHPGSQDLDALVERGFQVLERGARAMR
jgi:hypothetical protein